MLATEWSLENAEIHLKQIHPFGLYCNTSPEPDLLSFSFFFLLLVNLFCFDFDFCVPFSVIFFFNTALIVLAMSAICGEILV